MSSVSIVSLFSGVSVKHCGGKCDRWVAQHGMPTLHRTSEYTKWGNCSQGIYSALRMWVSDHEESENIGWRVDRHFPMRKIRRRAGSELFSDRYHHHFRLSLVLALTAACPRLRPSALLPRIWSSVQTEDSCFDPIPLFQCFSEFFTQIYPSERFVSFSFSSFFVLPFSAALKSAQHGCWYC